MQGKKNLYKFIHENIHTKTAGKFFVYSKYLGLEKYELNDMNNMKRFEDDTLLYQIESFQGTFVPVPHPSHEPLRTFS